MCRTLRRIACGIRCSGRCRLIEALGAMCGRIRRRIGMILLGWGLPLISRVGVETDLALDVGFRRLEAGFYTIS